MAVNYFAWLNIISLAVKLLNTSSGSEGIIVKVFTETTTEIRLSDTETTVWHIDIYGKETGVKLKGYILIPRQDIYASEDSGRFLFPFVPDAVFLTVNEFAVIYEETLQEPAMPKSKTLEPNIVKVRKILDIERNTIPVETRDNFTTTDGIQVIKQQIFPQHVDLQITKQGSTSVDYKNIKKLFPHKMILLSVIPDMGKVTQTWLSGGDVNFSYEFFKEQDTIIQKITTFLSKNEQVSSAGIENLKQEIKEIMTQKQVFVQETFDFFDLFINRILLWEEPKTFPGYYPKQTPDRVTDFMPQLADKINQLPVAEPNNLKRLIVLFEEYRKLAKKNKGQWVEGNPLQGGKPKEYHPTAEEVILGETGSRILTVLGKIKKTDWQNLRKQQKLKNKKLSFTRFSFIHYDVMGSGRFFYVNEMEKVIIKWNRKKFEVEEEKGNKLQ